MPVLLAILPHNLEDSAGQLTKLLNQSAGTIYDRIPLIVDGESCFQHISVEKDKIAPFIESAANAGIFVLTERHAS